MFGGLYQVFGLQIRFDTGKIESAAYGDVVWEVFFKSFDMNWVGDMMTPTMTFFSGDLDRDGFLNLC